MAEGERALDIGQGTGHALAALARTVGDEGLAVGVDLSPRMQQVARRRLRRAGLDAALVLADAAALPFRSGSFDAVFMSFVLELFDTPEIPVVLQEIRRVLPPDGRLGVAWRVLPSAAPPSFRHGRWSPMRVSGSSRRLGDRCGGSRSTSSLRPGRVEDVGPQQVGERVSVDVVVLHPGRGDGLGGQGVGHVGRDAGVGQEVGEPPPPVGGLEGDLHGLWLELERPLSSGEYFRGAIQSSKRSSPNDE